MSKKLILIFNIVIFIFIGVVVFFSNVKLDLHPSGSSEIDITSYDATITLTSEGSMMVAEEWSMDYDGDYSTRFRDIVYDKFPENYPLPKSDDNTATFNTENYNFYLNEEEYSDISNDMGTSFNGDMDELNEPVACPSNLGPNCESFFIHKYNTRFFDDQVFHYEFQIDDAVTEYSDIQELNWVLFSYAESVVEKGTVKILFPDEIDPNEVSVFTPNMEDATVVVTKDGITINFTEIHVDESLGFRILMPLGTLANISDSSTFIDEGINKQIIVDYENSLIEVDEPFDFDGLFMMLAAWGLSVLFLLIGNVSFKRHLKPHKVRFMKHSIVNPPSTDSPAIVGYLLRSDIPGKIDYAGATLLDLVNRGYLSVSDNDQDEVDIFEKYSYKDELSYAKQKMKSGVEEPNSMDVRYTLVKDNYKEDLLPHECYFINWYINEMGDGRKTSINRMGNYTDDLEGARQFERSSNMFMELVQKEASKQDLNDYEVWEDVTRVLPVIGVLLVFAGLLFYYMHTYDTLRFSALLILIGALSIFVFSLVTFKRKSQAGEKFAKEWLAYRSNLNSNDVLKDLSSFDPELYGHHMVFASLFGITDNVIYGMVIKTDDSKVVDNKEVFEYLIYQRHARRTSYYLRRRARERVRRYRREQARANNSRSSSGGFSSGGGGGGGRSR